MAREEQLRWEDRFAKPAAVAAFLSASFAAVSIGLRVSAGSSPDGDAEALRRVDEHLPELLGSLAAQAVALLLMAYALYYLLRATVARRPEVPRAVLPLVLLAPVLLIVGGFISQTAVADIADEFLASGPQTDRRAEDLLEDGSIVGQAIGSGGTLCLALSLVFVSLNAMRVGLLSRFMGILGILVGALLVLPLIPGGQVIVQVFWVAALGALFLGRWPGGRGPAWETGEAEPWPSAAEERAKAMEQVAPPQPSDAQPDEAPPSAKRKRKKRR